ncbi:amino acid ABC transporter permease [Chlamydiifrater phoenicopteri]|uniref:amino acid ABC transporter permease n=1 Tax=Chlamydiifrater phoenicopteri TaxID=2681469 RepID=UPI001FE9B793|nr:amino acid ABC transporter permease [Chlamydiifrater phoenicopteri]
MSNVFLLLKGCCYTLGIVAASIIIGSTLGLIIGGLTCRYSHSKWLSRLGTAYVTIVRGTPLFIQILILYFGLPVVLGPWFAFSPLVSGIIALGLNSAAYLAENIRGGINAVSSGQWEVAKVLGYSPKQTFFHVLMPQVVRSVFPSVANEYIALIKESSILMVVGVPELTKVSRDIVARELNPMEMYGIAALLYLVMTSLCAYLSRRVEKGECHEC